MKIKHILPALAVALPGLIQAVPADPRPRPVTNPDGTTVMVRMHGDEFFHFMTDLDCTKILEKDSRGFVVDAIRDGEKLSFSKDNVEMLRAETEIAYEHILSNDVSTKKRMGGLNTEGRSTYPTIGQGNRSLVVLVEFQDVSFTVENPKEYYTRQLNERGFSDYQAVGSAIDYYIASSNGLYVPQFDVYGPVKVSKEASQFAGMGDDNMKLFIEESLTQLHESGEVDFSNYDLDDDGIVDTVFFYYAGYGKADSETETIWPHQYDYRWCGSNAGANRLTFDEKKVGPYACANELDGYNPVTHRNPWKDGSEPWIGGIGTFVHEYGHVLGLPDLYDVEYSEDVKVVTPGKWDVMDAGSYNFNGCIPPLMSAYEQWVCHWIEFTDAADANHYDVNALGVSDNPSAVRIRIPKNSAQTTFEPEYFVIEARDNSSTWDKCFPESGLLVWRINYNKNTWLSNSVNSRKGSNVEIVYAKNQAFPIFTSGAIYSGSDVELIPSKNYSLWKSPIITDIAFDNENKRGSFDYNMVKPSDVFTVLHDVPEAAPDGSKAFRLTWDAVDDADSYLLTVRIKSSGRIIADFDAKNVGKETSVWVSGLSSTYWKLELEAFVQCVVNGMPSSSYSNIVTFKPSDLPLQGSSVESVQIVSDSISGGIGCVNAPDGAEVFDMSGKRLSKEALAPGIYIVKFANKTKKVIVR